MSQRDRTERWQLSGNSAEAYERYLVPAIFEPWAAALVELADPRPGERVLDVACGTGIVARLAAPRVASTGEVTGLDLNAGMLAVARDASSGVSPAIDWKEGSALSMPFSDAAFDVVLCEQGLQFFPDRPVALAEMRRVTVPDGRLALSVWRALEYNPIYDPVAEALERHAGHDSGAMMRSPFVLGDAEELRGLITEAGFREVRIRLAVELVRYPSAEEFLRREAASSPLAAPLSQLSDEVRAALISDIATALRSYRDDDGVAFPIEAHVAVARR